MEVVNIESTLYGLIEKPKLPSLKKGVAPERAIKHHRKSIFGASGKGVRAPVYDGARLGAGANIAGPAIIEEITTTIVDRAGLDCHAARQRFLRDREIGLVTTTRGLEAQIGSMSLGGAMAPRKPSVGS